MRNAITALADRDADRAASDRLRRIPTALKAERASQTRVTVDEEVLLQILDGRRGLS